MIFEQNKTVNVRQRYRHKVDKLMESETGQPFLEMFDGFFRRRNLAIAITELQSPRIFWSSLK